mgnify:CR=1 FL=1
MKLGANGYEVDGVAVYFSGKRWLACDGEKLGIIRLQMLYLFIDREESKRHMRFNRYVNKIIKQLIYN